MSSSAECAGSPERAETLAYNMLLQREAVEVSEALGTIPHAFVKGVVLAQEIYLSMGDRPMGDIDLLVMRTDVELVAEHLRKIGYEEDPLHPVPSNLAWRHEATFVAERGGVPVAVDVHWHLLHPQRFDLLDEDVWPRMRTVSLAEAEVLSTDETLTVLHLAAHYAQHLGRFDRPLNDLRLAFDAWGSQIDLEALWSLARSAGLEPILCLAMHAIEMDTSPAHLVSRLRSRIAAALLRLPVIHVAAVDLTGNATLLALLPRRYLWRHLRSVINVRRT